MRKLNRVLTRLYPRPWRERYGAEFETLLCDAGPQGRDTIDLFFGAMREHARVFLYRPWWHIAAAFVALGAVVGWAAVAVVPKRYESSAVVAVRVPPGERHDLNNLLRAALGYEGLLRIARDRGLHTGQADDRKVERMRLEIHLWGAAMDGNTAGLQFVAKDPRVAQEVVVDLIAAMARSAQAASVPLSVIDPPSLSPAPIYPNPSALAATGALAGLLLGCVVSAVVRLRQGRSPVPRGA